MINTLLIFTIVYWKSHIPSVLLLFALLTMHDIRQKVLWITVFSRTTLRLLLFCKYLHELQVLLYRYKGLM